MRRPTRRPDQIRGLSSVGRALPLQGRCQEFDSPRLHTGTYHFSGRSSVNELSRDMPRAHSLPTIAKLDLDRVCTVNGFAIASGTPGHGHVYVPVTEDLTVAEYVALCRGLVGYFGGDPGKIIAARASGAG
jgi:hypothetical protein